MLFTCTIDVAICRDLDGPAMLTRVGSQRWSICICAPVNCCSALIVSPFLPITLQTELQKASAYTSADSAFTPS